MNFGPVSVDDERGVEWDLEFLCVSCSPCTEKGWTCRNAVLEVLGKNIIQVQPIA